MRKGQDEERMSMMMTTITDECEFILRLFLLSACSATLHSEGTKASASERDLSVCFIFHITIYYAF